MHTNNILHLFTSHRYQLSKDPRPFSIFEETSFGSWFPSCLGLRVKPNLTKPSFRTAASKADSNAFRPATKEQIKMALTCGIPNGKKKLQNSSKMSKVFKGTKCFLQTGGALGVFVVSTLGRDGSPGPARSFFPGSRSTRLRDQSREKDQQNAKIISDI